MTPGSANLLLAAADAGGYQISRSLRFRSSASAYLNRTMGTGSTQKYTYSAWVKRGKLGTACVILSTNRSFATTIEFLSNDTMLVYTGDGSSTGSWNWTTTQVFRDPSAWYHIVVAWDTTQATATDRLKVYVNGVQVTSWSTQQTITQNMALGINGANALIPNSAFDGYLAEVNFIDGQQLAASSFGETDTTTGAWKPKRYTGTYSTNGFYLNFSDNSAATAAAIGKDSSGNGNNWTPNNISVTSGVTYDSMIDTPTPYDDGTVYGRGNYPTLNPLWAQSGILLDGNIRLTNAAAAYYHSPSTIAIPSGSSKIYFEATVLSNTSSASGVEIGITNQQGISRTTRLNTVVTSGVIMNCTNGVDTSTTENGTFRFVSPTAPAGTVLQVAYDPSTGKVWIGRNNSWYNSSGGTTGDPAAGSNQTGTVSGSDYFPIFSCYANTLNVNFGQRPFVYTPPSGYKALNTQNLPTPTILAGNKYFDATTYSGNGGTQTISSLLFQPDLIWQKNRSSAANNILVDSVRGGSVYLVSNSTGADASAPGYMTFNSNGETFVSSSIETNQSGQSYIAWQWKKGATPGFDIVTYTAPSSPAASSYSHSLGVKPDMMIVKARNLASRNWAVYHKSLGATQCLRLNLTNAAASVSTYWNNTEPTSTVFTVGTDNDTNANTYNYVAYLFSEVAGFSKFGSYTGNGSADGPFVYCGFRPRFILVKRTDTTGDWFIYDTARNAYNVAPNYLQPNLTSAEGVGDTYDILSNGFKNRNTFAAINASGGTYIFAAFAENPFKYALAR